MRRNMEPLSEPDYLELLDCIGQLHAFRELAELRNWLLDFALPRLVPSDWISYNEVDLVTPENTLAILKPETDHIFEQLFPRFREVIHEHPLITRQMQATTFPVHKISDFIAQDDYHKLSLYQDVYRHMRVEYQMAATIKLEPERVTAFALSREKADYTERDRAVLEALRPHLVVAFNNLALSQRSEAKLNYANLALEELSAATIIVSAPGQILYHTSDGLEWIGVKNREFLPKNILAWLSQPPTRGSSPGLDLVTQAGNIHIRAVPTVSRERFLLVVTQKQTSPADGTKQNQFGLSQREREVASWICQGKTNAEIAIILGISPRTIHKHVEHIFEKSGAESRFALALLLNGKAAKIAGSIGRQ